MTGYQLTKAFYAELMLNEDMQLHAKSHHLSLYTWICELRNRVGMEVVDLPRDYTMKMALIGSPTTFKNCIDDLARWDIIQIMKPGKNNWTGPAKVKLSGSFMNRHEREGEEQDPNSRSEMNRYSNSDEERESSSGSEVNNNSATDESSRSEMNDNRTATPQSESSCGSKMNGNTKIPATSGSEMNSNRTATTEKTEKLLFKNEPQPNTTKTNKTKREKDISLGGDSKNEGAALDESATEVALETEPSTGDTQPPPQPPRDPAGQRNADRLPAAGLPSSELPGNGSPVTSPVRSTAGGKGKAAKAESGQEAVPAKQPYRDNVTLSESEYDTLCQKHGPDFTERCLDKLSSYKLAHGKTYKSDYGAINQWVIIAVTKDDSMATGAPSGNFPNSKPLTTAPMPTHQTKIR